MRVLAILLLAVLPAQAASVCEPRVEVRRILDDKVSEKTLPDLKFADRVAFRRQVLEDLIARYPNEVEPHRRLIAATQQDEPDQFPALVDRYLRQAGQHPDDPLALYLAGLAVYRKDTPHSIRLFERARSLDPGFPWPALGLANIYTHGEKRADTRKSADEIAAFFTACPSSTDREAQHRLDRAGPPPLQAQVAGAIRARLATESDPNRLKDYETLWGLEFRTRPAQEHGAMRKQVLADLHRIQPLNPHPDAGWLEFLKNGYKRAGASPETMTAMEDRVIAAFPHSEEAYQIVRERWEIAHREPEDGSDAAFWTAYNTEYRAALKGWIARFTEARELQHEEWFDAIRHDPNLPAEEGLPALDDYLAYVNAYQQPALRHYLAAAEFLVDHNWQPRRVFDLLQNASQWKDRPLAAWTGDNLAPETEEMLAFNELNRRQIAVSLVLAAARLAEQPSEAEPLKPFIERDPPARSSPNIAVIYWWNRARLAALEGRKADALAYYQKGLQAPTVPLRAFQGRTDDKLTGEARALWKQLGGTDAAWAVWSKPAAHIQQASGGGWTNPTKTLPSFELADLSGKTWRLTNLKGRSVLINVWATWCGPCQVELPKLEKLYRRIKDRTDVQILTLTIDEDVGLVAPFMKEKGYTFPVLPAYSFVTSLLDLVGIPQNWIVDSNGEWRWTGAPAVPDDAWENAMLLKLESVR